MYDNRELTRYSANFFSIWTSEDVRRHEHMAANGRTPSIRKYAETMLQGHDEYEASKELARQARELRIVGGRNA